MPLEDSVPPTGPVATDTLGRRFLFALAVLAVLCSLSFARWPSPGINETHYLAKAKHFADPSWCAGDFFLESSNPHAATSWLLGELTSRFSFERSAAIGRLLALVVLAAGWTLMLCGTLPGWRERILTTSLFCGLHILGNWSGEWLLRGVEGKVFAWGFLLLAIGLWTSRKPVMAGASLGSAFTFHPVIGAWGALCAILSFAWAAMDRRRTQRTETSLAESGRGSVSLPAIAGGAILFALTAAPGFVAALPALRLGTPDERWQADHIQVAQRLAHHLDPAQFLWSSHREYLLLIAALLLIPRGRNWTALERMGWMSVLCAVGGMVVAIWPREMHPFSLYVLRLKLLKLYPFRLADIFVPLLLSVRLAGWLRSIAPWKAGWWRFAPLSAALLGIAWFWPGDEKPARKMTLAEFEDWKAVLGWIRTETAPDAVVQSMNEDFAIKWYAERAEYVNYKDCPQDAPGIMEWHRRLLWLDQQWRTPAIADMRVSTAELAALHQQTGIDYLICSRFGPIEGTPVFAKGAFRVYRLTPAASSAGGAP